MFVTLRLRGDREEYACEVTGFTVDELRASCDYIRSLLDFGASDSASPLAHDGAGSRVAAYDVQTGVCRPSLAASVVYHLLRGSHTAPLEVDGSNAAELLGLADLWCLDQVKHLVVASLRRNMCSSFRRPAAGTGAIEAVPQVATLLRQALDFGLGDPDGGLQRLYDECTTWMATWAARVWPTRTFAGLQRSIQNDVLAAARVRISPETAPAVLASCRQLSGMPSVAWAQRVGEMQTELTSYAMSYMWSNFTEVCVHAGTRRDRSECWGALLEELRAHVAENPDPDAAVRCLPRWGLATRALLYGKAPGARRQAGAQPDWALRGPGNNEEGASWLGEDEAAQMQELYEHVRSYCVRHMALIARCASFRALPRAQQQQLLQIAQEGVGSAAGAGGSASAFASATAAANSPHAGAGAATDPRPGSPWWSQPQIQSQQQQQLGDEAASPMGRPGSSRSSAMWVIPGPGPASLGSPSTPASSSAASAQLPSGSRRREAAAATAAGAPPPRQGPGTPGMAASTSARRLAAAAAASAPSSSAAAAAQAQREPRERRAFGGAGSPAQPPPHHSAAAPGRTAARAASRAATADGPGGSRPSRTLSEWPAAGRRAQPSPLAAGAGPARATSVGLAAASGQGPGSSGPAVSRVISSLLDAEPAAATAAPAASVADGGIANLVVDMLMESGMEASSSGFPGFAATADPPTCSGSLAERLAESMDSLGVPLRTSSSRDRARDCERQGPDSAEPWNPGEVLIRPEPPEGDEGHLQQVMSFTLRTEVLPQSGEPIGAAAGEPGEPGHDQDDRPEHDVPAPAPAQMLPGPELPQSPREIPAVAEQNALFEAHAPLGQEGGQWPPLLPPQAPAEDGEALQAGREDLQPSEPPPRAVGAPWTWIGRGLSEAGTATGSVPCLDPVETDPAVHALSGGGVHPDTETDCDGGKDSEDGPGGVAVSASAMFMRVGAAADQDKEDLVDGATAVAVAANRQGENREDGGALVTPRVQATGGSPDSCSPRVIIDSAMSLPSSASVASSVGGRSAGVRATVVVDGGETLDAQPPVGAAVVTPAAAAKLAAAEVLLLDGACRDAAERGADTGVDGPVMDGGLGVPVEAQESPVDAPEAPVTPVGGSALAQHERKGDRSGGGADDASGPGLGACDEEAETLGIMGPSSQSGRAAHGASACSGRDGALRLEVVGDQHEPAAAEAVVQGAVSKEAQMAAPVSPRAAAEEGAAQPGAAAEAVAAVSTQAVAQRGPTPANAAVAVSALAAEMVAHADMHHPSSGSDAASLPAFSSGALPSSLTGSGGGSSSNGGSVGPGAQDPAPATAARIPATIELAPVAASTPGGPREKASHERAIPRPSTQPGAAVAASPAGAPGAASPAAASSSARSRTIPRGSALPVVPRAVSPAPAGPSASSRLPAAGPRTAASTTVAPATTSTSSRTARNPLAAVRPTATPAASAAVSTKPVGPRSAAVRDHAAAAVASAAGPVTRGGPGAEVSSSRPAGGTRAARSQTPPPPLAAVAAATVTVDDQTRVARPTSATTRGFGGGAASPAAGGHTSAKSGAVAGRRILKPAGAAAPATSAADSPTPAAVASGTAHHHQLSGQAPSKRLPAAAAAGSPAAAAARNTPQPTGAAGRSTSTQRPGPRAATHAVPGPSPPTASKPQGAKTPTPTPAVTAAAKPTALPRPQSAATTSSPRPGMAGRAGGGGGGASQLPSPTAASSSSPAVAAAAAASPGARPPAAGTPSAPRQSRLSFLRASADSVTTLRAQAQGGLPPQPERSVAGPVAHKIEIPADIVMDGAALDEDTDIRDETVPATAPGGRGDETAELHAAPRATVAEPPASLRAASPRPVSSKIGFIPSPTQPSGNPEPVAAPAGLTAVRTSARAPSADRHAAVRASWSPASGIPSMAAAAPPPPRAVPGSGIPRPAMTRSAVGAAAVSCDRSHAARATGAAAAAVGTAATAKTGLPQRRVVGRGEKPPRGPSGTGEAVVSGPGGVAADAQAGAKASAWR